LVVNWLFCLPGILSPEDFSILSNHRFFLIVNGLN
jgi:hypothetical protein